jgi:hypothetical protein
MHRTLEQAMPKLRTFPWDHYGDKITLRDEGGVRKYQNVTIVSCRTSFTTPPILSHFVSLEGVEERVSAIGKKLELLDSYPEIRASIERRNPSLGFWGGGIRGSDSEVRSALSGFNEIGDHDVLSHLMYLHELLTDQDWRATPGPGHSCVDEAMERIGMSPQGYVAQSTALYQILFATKRITSG